MEPVSTVLLLTTLRCRSHRVEHGRWLLVAWFAAEALHTIHDIQDVAYGTGYVVTGWNLSLPIPLIRFTNDVTMRKVWIRGLPQLKQSQLMVLLAPSLPFKLPLDFDGAVANCTWFAG
jgi:hypothetical protein